MAFELIECPTCGARTLRSPNNTCANCKQALPVGASPGSAVAQPAKSPAATAEEVRRVAVRNMKIGAVWALLGGLFTLLLYGAASVHGGPYLVAYGAMGYGAIRFVVGCSNYRR